MNARMFVIVGIAVAAAAALALYFHFWRSGTGPVARVENGFEFTVQGPLQSVAPLFGAFAERGWAGKQWNPQFLYPQPARDVEGEVFIVRHGHLEATWVNTAFDLATGHVQYVYTIPEAQAVLIDIHLQEVDPSTTGVRVVYQRTALSPRFNRHVTEQGDKDRNSAKEWQSAINAYLQRTAATQ